MAFIKNNLANSFIRPSWSLTGVSILFNKKLDKSLRLCIDYQGVNNLIIKSWYPLFFVRELLNQLSQAQCFTKLDITNIYHQMKIKRDNDWKMAFKTYYAHFVY